MIMTAQDSLSNTQAAAVGAHIDQWIAMEDTAAEITDEKRWNDYRAFLNQADHERVRIELGKLNNIRGIKHDRELARYYALRYQVAERLASEMFAAFMEVVAIMQRMK